ncbi:MAG: hypothetical protein ABIJ08_04625, partial [Nanoarchaeota archaeon]
LIYNGRNTLKNMTRMITRPETGVFPQINMKDKTNFMDYFTGEVESDLIYFIDSERGVMVPVKGQLRNSYTSQDGQEMTIEALLKAGALPRNYLCAEGSIPVSKIGGRTEVAIVTSARFPSLYVVVANQRAYGMGMGKASLFKEGKLVKDIRFEPEYPYADRCVDQEHNIAGIITTYKPMKNRLIPDYEEYAYYAEDGSLALSPQRKVKRSDLPMKVCLTYNGHLQDKRPVLP